MMKTGTEAVRARLGGFHLASVSTPAALLATPGFHLSLGATAAAFVLQQVAFSRGRVSVSVPVIGVGATIVAVGLGAALLHEPVSAARALGVATVVAGTLLLGGREERAPRVAATPDASTGRPRWS
jgi:drug/metabolite transporter (DMT)-like permease